MTKTTTATKTTASVYINNTLFSVSGILGEDEWTVTMSFPKSRAIESRSWTENSFYLLDQDDLEKFLWQEVARILAHYNSVEISTEEVEVEDED